MDACEVVATSLVFLLVVFCLGSGSQRISIA